jgi:hypothetical protein
MRKQLACFPEFEQPLYTLPAKLHVVGPSIAPELQTGQEGRTITFPSIDLPSGFCTDAAIQLAATLRFASLQILF